MFFVVVLILYVLSDIYQNFHGHICSTVLSYAQYSQVQQQTTKMVQGWSMCEVQASRARKNWFWTDLKREGGL